MHLRSITIRGFKSFPNRTKLEFGPGVSVIVGPNGSGKSNVTDAVLWALGEQSPLAVRGQTMRDVIFAGGHGVKGSSSAEVEVVIDNQDHALDSDFSEISIARRLERDGEGEYRLNGARCRLVDVLEVLSDSGLGKEMHSVVSQGKVEAIVLSRPRDRRLLIEEAAGLGKHRKRRRRAELKLERTEENLSRALDVEREARSRLRPLKRQAEAAQLHERIERQALEARLELAQDDVRGIRLELGLAESKAAAARDRRDQAERLLAAVAERREAAEASFAALGQARERLQARVFAARSAADRIGMRLERARETAAAARERAERRRSQLDVLEGQDAPGAQADGAKNRIEALERELATLEAGREERLAGELSGLETERDEAQRRREALESEVEEQRRELESADHRVEEARAALRQAERAMEAAGAQAARASAELAAVEQFVRGTATAPPGVRSLAEGLGVEPGYERALAAALGPLLAAGLVEDLPAGEQLLDEAGEQGAVALISSRVRARRAGHAPLPGAQRLFSHLRPEPSLRSLAERLLGDVWVVDSLEQVSAYFDGMAVTRSGRLLDASTGGLVQAPAGGSERVLEQTNRRGGLVEASERAAEDESRARAEVDAAGERLRNADREREEAEVALRRRVREAQEATDAVARCEWAIARRREAPDEGPDAVRRAELAADLRAERRLAERLERERAERLAAIEALRMGIERDTGLVGRAERAAEALAEALAGVGATRDALEAELEEGAAAGEQTAATLRACAHEEAELQRTLRDASEAVTSAEVAAQQVRDSAAERERELAEVRKKLGMGESAAGEDPAARPANAGDVLAEPLGEERRAELAARIERLARRREQLGPVNPLAAREYEEAVAHVEELEAQRADLEAALAELEGLIRETDRRIREAFEQTFAAAARNFEEVVGHLFPGGRGRLRLVQAEQGPRPVIGDAGPEDEPETAVEDGADQEPDAGVEVEVTPAGKATRRLSLLSGGEKSLVALAFMFAVFLARPCPFYILDEVEAALDDVNIDRFLELVRRYSERSQFIVVTHQKRTMDAADTLYGVSMGGDGISRVLSRRLAGAPAAEQAAPGEDVRAASA